MQVGFNRKILGPRKFQHIVGKILVPVLLLDGGNLVPDGGGLFKGKAVGEFLHLLFQNIGLVNITADITEKLFRKGKRLLLKCDTV